MAAAASHPSYINIDDDNSHSQTTSSKILPLLPLALSLLAISALTLLGTLITLAVSTPLFLMFSPILIPAALAIAGFLTSGAFGLTSLSSITWLFNYLRMIGRQQTSKNAAAVGGLSDDRTARTWID